MTMQVLGRLAHSRAPGICNYSPGVDFITTEIASLIIMIHDFLNFLKFLIDMYLFVVL